MFLYKKASATIFLVLLFILNSSLVLALPSLDSQVGVNIDPSVPGELTITKLLPGASPLNHERLGKIKWSGFSIAVGETVNFVFTGADQVILNYVDLSGSGGGPPAGNAISIIEGAINVTGQGKVLLVNPNGLFFRDGSTVASTAGGTFFASNMNITNFPLINDGVQDVIFSENTFTATLPDTNTYSNLRNGFEFRGISSVSGFDRVTLYSDGLRIGARPPFDPSSISANDNVQILTAGGATYAIPSDSFSGEAGSSIPNLNICYDGGAHETPPAIDAQYSDSFGNFSLGQNASITVSSGNVSIRNISDQDKFGSSIDIQGTINANATANGEGEIFLSSENRDPTQIGFINITETGVLNSTAPCPITPPVTLDVDNEPDGEIQSIDYVLSFSGTNPFIFPDTGNPTQTPTGPTAKGTINMKEFPDLTLVSDTQTFPNTVTGVNQRTVDLGVGATEGQLEVNLDPCPPPPPPDDGGGAAVAIAVPLGVAGVAGIGSLFAGAPLLAGKPVYPSVTVMRPYYVCPREEYVCTAEGYKRAVRYYLRPAYSQTTGAAAGMNETNAPAAAGMNETNAPAAAGMNEAGAPTAAPANRGYYYYPQNTNQGYYYYSQNPGRTR